MSINTTWACLLDYHADARGDAKTTFTTYQDVAGTATNKPLPYVKGGELKKGMILEIEAWGEFSTTGTPTLSIGVVYNASPGATGGTALGQTGTITTGSGAAAWPWHYNGQGKITAVGTSGSIEFMGILDLGTSLTAYATGVPGPTTAAGRIVTIDTTTANINFGLGAAWGTSSASNSITVIMFNVKIFNAGKT